MNPLIEADAIARHSQMIQHKLHAGQFALHTYSRIQNIDQLIHIYIEGDGLAWRTKTQVSADPTPTQQLTLQLASVDDAQNIVYIARPCQFQDLTKTACDQAYWTSKRFAEEVVASVNLAVDYYVNQLQQPQVYLIGYSGGGAIATLIAARRTDVVALTTIAGNLDTEKLNLYHGVSAMPDALNPADYAGQINQLPQLHLVGGEDKVVPLSIVEAFIKKLPNKHCAQVFVVKNASHDKGWVERWPSLLSEHRGCEK